MSAHVPTLGALASFQDAFFTYQGSLNAAAYDIMDGSEILSDFRTLQYYIISAQTDPDDARDYHTEGWATLRQCAIDGHHILECAADTRVPVAQGGEKEQTKAELKQYELESLTDESVYAELAAADNALGRWTAEDPSLRHVVRWLRARQR
ncbi:hypothetical protein UVI_02029220 [Ustilaginoidea virens]|uniref:Uncharacterized protein n=1 Tax=Ustilaginoidea virens TaxID=1159556 RepID=A0A1B5KVX5_USTVR|nr:hypothetical protein UVI_02029220 [Ustilaginoidea virens]